MLSTCDFMLSKGAFMRFGGIGICAKCCDTQGPWTWTSLGWLCDKCAGELDDVSDKIKDSDESIRSGNDAKAENEREG